MSRNTGFNIRKVTEKYISKEKKVLFTINTQSGLGLCPFNLHPICSSSAQKKYIFFKVHAQENLRWHSQNHFSGCRLKEG